MRNVQSYVVKERNGFSMKNGKKIVLLSKTRSVAMQRRLSSVNHVEIKTKSKSVWIKASRKNGLKLYNSFVKGARKYSTPSKKIIIMNQKDLSEFKREYKPLLTYTPSSSTVWVGVFRMNKEDQVHIDSPASKIMAFCKLDGQITVEKDYVEHNKTPAVATLHLLRGLNIDMVDCIWKKSFAELVCYLGILDQR